MGAFIGDGRLDYRPETIAEIYYSLAAGRHAWLTLDLQRISIGGSVFLHHSAFLLPKLRAQIAGRLPALTEGCDIVPAGLGERVGDYAALALLA